jgi:FlaA1/EpsC-like NDP-sugar epimerase
MISLEDAVKLIWHAFDDMLGGEIYVKKIPSMTILEIAKAVSKDAKHKIIGVRPGEKIHEQMFGLEDAPHTFEYDDHYKILPAIYNWSSDPDRNSGGKKVENDFIYSSVNNREWMSVDELREWIQKNNNIIGRI